MFTKSGLSALALGFLVSGPASRPALAATPTTTFGVTATVEAACLVSAKPVAFGTHAGTVVNFTPGVSVSCTNTAPYDVGVSGGLATVADVMNRKLTQPASATLSRLISRDGAPVPSRGDTAGTVPRIPEVYGAPMQYSHDRPESAKQPVAPGGITDTIVVTVTF